MAADKTLACRDCGTEYVFTAGEQEFFAQKGFSEPTRCPACRATRKRERMLAQSDEMGGAPQGSPSTGGGGGRGRDRDRDRRGGRDDDFDFGERPRRGRW